MGSTCTTVTRIYRFPGLSRPMLARISAGRHEAARVWNLCKDLHMAARRSSAPWPNAMDLHRATKGRFAMAAQSVQATWRAFLGNIDTTRELRESGHHQIRYPWRDKRYYPLLWPAQAVGVQGTHIILPMGRGRASIVLPKPEGLTSGGCKLVWNGAENELHVATEVPVATQAPGERKATIDLGQIHQCALMADNGASLIVSGRGQRSLKRRMNQMHGRIARLQARCKDGSRRRKRLARTRHRLASRLDRRIRDLAHKGTRAVADFCAHQQVGEVFIGDPSGVRNQRCGRHHNQRIAQWELGRDKHYLVQKLGRFGIASFTGSERGTSSRCPRCGHRHKPTGRVWHCIACGFIGHRDLVGAANMHEDNFAKLTEFPSYKDVTYLRPGRTSVRQTWGTKTSRPGSSSRPDTGHGVLDAALLLERNLDTSAEGSLERVSQETGHQATQRTEAHPL